MTEDFEKAIKTLEPGFLNMMNVEEMLKQADKCLEFLSEVDIEDLDEDEASFYFTFAAIFRYSFLVLDFCGKTKNEEEDHKKFLLFKDYMEKINKNWHFI